MSIIFYDHLIDRTEIHIHLDKLDLPEEKKSEFRSTIDNIIHAGLMEWILQKLHPHHHQTFLNRLQQAPYDPELIRYLKDHINEAVEDSLQQQSQKIIKQVTADLDSVE